MKTFLSFRLWILISMLLSCQLLAAEGQQPRFKLMGMGDSITEGDYNFSTYLYPLWKKLFDAGYQFDFVGPHFSISPVGKLNHCGYRGKTAEFLASLSDSICHIYKPDIVLLHAGHNHDAAEKPIEGIINSYKTIIASILRANPQAYIFLAQVTPSGKLPKYAYIPELNRRIKELVNSYHSKNLVLVDMASGHRWSTMTIEDKVHPNSLGSERMANIWMKSLKKRIKRAPIR